MKYTHLYFLTKTKTKAIVLPVKAKSQELNSGERISAVLICDLQGLTIPDSGVDSSMNDVDGLTGLSVQQQNPNQLGQQGAYIITLCDLLHICTIRNVQNNFSNYYRASRLDNLKQSFRPWW